MSENVPLDLLSHYYNALTQPDAMETVKASVSFDDESNPFRDVSCEDDIRGTYMLTI